MRYLNIWDSSYACTTERIIIKDLMNPDCQPSKGVPLRILGIRNKEYMQNTGFYTSAFAINNWTTPQEGSRECVWPPEQFWRFTPCLSQTLKSLHGPRGVPWGLPGSKGVPSPCGTNLEELLAPGEGCSMLQAMGKFQCWLSQPMCLYMVFKACLVFLFSGKFMRLN